MKYVLIVGLSFLLFCAQNKDDVSIGADKYFIEMYKSERSRVLREHLSESQIVSVKIINKTITKTKNPGYIYLAIVEFEEVLSNDSKERRKKDFLYNRLTKRWESLKSSYYKKQELQ